MNNLDEGKISYVIQMYCSDYLTKDSCFWGYFLFC